MATARRDLIRGLWPDKTMQAALLVLLASGASLLFYAQRAIFTPRFSETVPAFMRAEPSQVMAFFALLAGAFALVAIYRKHVAWAWAAVAFCALSVGPLGSGILIALAAAGSLLFAHAEDEHRNPRTRALSPKDWPDKAFAAGLVLIVVGIVNTLWGGALLLGLLILSFAPALGLGLFALLTAALSFWSARELRHERGFALGMLACLLGVLSLGLYVIGPLLALVAALLLLFGHREGEFQRNAR